MKPNMKVEERICDFIAKRIVRKNKGKDFVLWVRVNGEWYQLTIEKYQTFEEQLNEMIKKAREARDYKSERFLSKCLKQIVGVK